MINKEASYFSLNGAEGILRRINVVNAKIPIYLTWKQTKAKQVLPWQIHDFVTYILPLFFFFCNMNFKTASIDINIFVSMFLMHQRSISMFPTGY